MMGAREAVPVLLRETPVEWCAAPAWITSIPEREKIFVWATRSVEIWCPIQEGGKLNQTLNMRNNSERLPWPMTTGDVETTL
jgi:hypothetical protein